MFYRGLPLNIIDPDRVTDYRYTPNYVYSYFYEGFSIGKMNNEGYNNTFDFTRGMSLDVLLMGPSHMEAFQVMPEENTANLLSNLSHQTVYNVGVSGHSLQTCASHFEAAVKKYSPSRYVVMGIANIRLSDEVLTSVLEHNVPNVDKNFGQRSALRLFLRENPYLRFVWGKVHDTLKNNFLRKTELPASFSQNNPELLAKVLAQMSDTLSQSKSGAKLIIAYHPPVSLNLDGSLKIESDPEVSRQFSELCAQNGIYFLDMSERFLSEYAKDYTLPYGFINTSVASGHLNKYGHRMFAEEIYKLMQRIEAQS